MRHFRFHFLVLCLLAASTLLAGAESAQRVSLDGAVIVIDSSEPSYVQYGANDLGKYLTEINGKATSVVANAKAVGKARTVIAIGEKAALAMGADLASAGDLGGEGSVIRSFEKGKAQVIAVAGSNPHGTNMGIATFMQAIHVEGKSAYVNNPLDLHSKPSFAARGIHLNGWPLNYPYAFRSWKEADWKHFVDIAWAQRINLFYLWPFMEIIPVPLSPEDEAYLQEVQRVVDYAQNQRGMQVWIMQSANRVAVSDCKVKDPRFRTYWVPRDCQQDMDPSNPEQFARILKHFEAFYKIVNNAEGFCFIDSDPGGWPGSPLSDQTKIFNGARKLLDQYNVHKEKTKLIDWMWLGWGRHPSGDESGKQAIAFMEKSIGNFKANLTEPWQLIAGMGHYLESAKNQSVLDRTIFLQYGAIELEPAFPATNLGLKSVQEVFDTAAKYPGLEGIMGNNELMSLQLPRTFYFYNRAWDAGYKDRTEPEMLTELGRQLYPDHQQLIAAAYQGLREDNPEKIAPTLAELSKLVKSGEAGQAGAIGRYLFPDRLTIAKNLEQQLGIRAARQRFIAAMNRTDKPDVKESSQLLEDYFDKLLAWNHETGWDKMIDITIWNIPIYEKDKDLREATSNLRKVLAQDKPYTSYTQIADFFDGISGHLLQKYGRDSVMIGCIDSFKLAVIQGM
ncbi:MAG TPA: hypothetical protein VLK33_05345 [Terriglobales bacterium]|nr:hypothetical protein [Terriglobales bacterium]